MTERRRGIPLVLLLVTACAAPVSTPVTSSTNAPSQSATSEPSVVAVSPAPTTSPTPILAPVIDLGLGPSTVAVASVDEVPVRAAPDQDAPFMALYSSSGARELIDETATLSAGQVVLVQHGPIVIAGRPWFLVSNIDDAHPNERWVGGYGVLDSDDQRWQSRASLWGWVLGADGTTAFLAPTGEPSGAEGTAYALMHGVGGADSAEFEFSGAGGFPGPFPAGVEWVAGAVDGQTCDLRITMEPVGSVVVDERITQVGAGFTWWPKEGEVPPGGHRFSIESDCSWSLHAAPSIG